jgi:hypothetical protein
MNFDSFGGDNRDHGKGFVLDAIAPLLQGFQVDPMISNQDWPTRPLQERETWLGWYRWFLRLQPDHQIANAATPFNGKADVERGGLMQPYFAPHIGKEHDLFLDADTGVGDGGREHVPYRVIGEMLSKASTRLLMVYVTPSFNNPSGLIELSRINEWFPTRFGGFVCDLGGNQIMFLAVAGNERLASVKSALKERLGPFADRRVKP